MKKYFVTSIFTVMFLCVSLLSCTKDVSGTNSAYKANAGNVSNINKKPIITQDESVYTKRLVALPLPVFPQKSDKL